MELSRLMSGQMVFITETYMERQTWLDSVRKPGHCSDCKETKPLAEFSKNSARPNGISHVCKACMSKRMKRWQRKLSKKRRAEIREANNAATRRYRRNPTTRIKVAAHQIVWNAMQLGILVRKPCEQCGCKPTDAHHDDYMKPLEVRWLCRSCHKIHHAVSPE